MIPNVVISEVMSMGPKSYGMLVTDQRCIFVLEKSSKAALIGVLGDALLTDRKSVDYENLSPEELAADKKNIALRHSIVRDVELKKKMSGYFLTFDWVTKSGKGSIKCILAPPAELLQKKKSEGVDKKAATEEYARNVRKILEKALPIDVTQKAKWDV